MSIDQPYLTVLLAVLGLIAGSLIVFAAPRLVAHRLAERPPFPPFMILLPVAGVVTQGWHLRKSLTVEIVTAALFAGLAIHYGWSIRLTLGAVYTALLVTIAYIDVDYRLVLNLLSYPGIVIGLLGSLVWPDIGLLTSVSGALVGLVIFGLLQVFGRGALGMGDTKLAILIGAMRGISGGLNALGLGIVLGGVGAVFFLLVLRKGRKEYMAYAPYLAAGAILSFFLVAP
ncbi:MAG: prepilin peptidase [Chloroflexota bacterium]